MDDFRIVVPPHVVQRLRTNRIPDERIRHRVRTMVIRTLEELAARPPASKPKADETAVEYFRRIFVDINGGKPPSLDEPFADGLTLGQWLAMGDEKQEALWEKWEEVEWKKLEKKYGEGVDVKLKPRALRQERRAQVPRRARETRAKYAARSKRAGRVRSAQR